MLVKKTDNEKINEFVDEYCIDHNGERAARAIGVQPSQALMRSKRLLEREDVQQLITIRKDEIHKHAAISPEWVLCEIKYQYLNAKADNDRSNSMKALEMLAKHVQLFADRDKGEAQVTVIVQNYADVKIDS